MPKMFENVVFDMVYGLMVSCHAMLKILFLVALPQGYITLCYHVTPGHIQPSPNHPFPIPFLLFPCPTRTNLEILPKLVLSHLVTNPILPIFFPSPSVGNFAHTGLEPTTLHPFLPFFLKAGKSKS